MQTCCFQGIGDSSQGFANSVLFIGFTKPIRRRFLQVIKRALCCKERCCQDRGIGHLIPVATERDQLLTNSNNSITDDRVLTCEIHH